MDARVQRKTLEEGREGEQARAQNCEGPAIAAHAHATESGSRRRMMMRVKGTQDRGAQPCGCDNRAVGEWAPASALHRSDDGVSRDGRARRADRSGFPALWLRGDAVRSRRARVCSRVPPPTCPPVASLASLSFDKTENRSFRPKERGDFLSTASFLY